MIYRETDHKTKPVWHLKLWPLAVAMLISLGLWAIIIWAGMNLWEML